MKHDHLPADEFHGPALRSAPAHALRMIVYRLLRRWAEEHHRELPFDPAVPAYDLMARRMLIWGFYEREHLDTLMHFLAFARERMRNGICVDAGANIGSHSLYFSRFFDKIIAFEPNREVREILQINARRAGNIEVVPKGLGANTSQGVIMAPRGNLGAGRLVEEATPSKAGLPDEQVEVVRLDDFFADRQEEAQRVVLLKVDTEGYERAILQGARELLRQARPVVMFEVHADALRDEERNPVPVLEEAGYRFHVWQRPFGLGRSKPEKLLSGLLQLFLGRRLVLSRVAARDIPVRNHRFIIAVHPDMP